MLGTANLGASQFWWTPIESRQRGACGHATEYEVPLPKWSRWSDT